MDQDTKPPTHQAFDSARLFGERYFCHEMRLYDMFGGPVFLSYTDLWRLLTDWKTIGLVALIALAMFGADPHAYRGHMPAIYSLLLWQIGAITLVLTKLCTFFFLSIFTKHFPEKRIWLPALSWLEYSFALIVVLWLEPLFVDDSYSFDIWGTYPYMTMTMLILEFLFVRFLMSSIVAPQKAAKRETSATAQASATETAVNAVKTLTIGARTLRLDMIRYITSEEHYLRIVLQHEEFVIRAKLAEVLEQVSPDDGVRTHRSWWISRHAHPVLIRDRDRFQVRLGEDRFAPVARSRTKDVQDWFDLYRDW